MGASFPMKLGVCPVWRWYVWKFFPGLRCFPFAITVHPPLGGGPWLSRHHDFVVAADRYDDDYYVREGPLTS